MQNFKEAGMGILLLLAGNLMAQNEAGQSLSGEEIFGGMRARHIGPALMSGRITDLEAHPTDARTFYIGTAGGGVWKSNNGGASATPVFDDYPQSIGVVKVDPKNPETVWVGTGETWTRNSTSIGKGLYKSTDGGANWQLMGLENSERISSIVLHPENSDIIYVGVLGALWGDSEERGIFRSTDGGVNWEKLFYIDASTGVSDLEIDPRNPQVMYASMWQFRRTAWSFNSGGEKSALYKSTDGGAHWQKIHQGFPPGKLGRIAFALAPSNPDILYAAIEAEENKDKGLYRSDDAGQNWKLLNNDFELVVRPFYFSRLVVDPRNPEVLAKGGLSGSLSRDGGNTFKTLGNMHADIHDILFHPEDADRIYAATDGGVYRSWDGGNTFEMIQNIPVSQFYHISVDMEEPYNIYGGLQDNGSWYGPSSSPGGIEHRDWHSVGVGDGFRVLRHPTKRIVYSEMQGAENIWRFDMDKKMVKTIQPLREKGDPKLRFNWNAPIALSPHKPDRLYVGSQFLHRSEDMGDSWQKISPDLSTNNPAKQNAAASGGLSVDNSGAENHTTIFTIAESPLDENIIWVGTDDGNVQLTRDGGKSWQNTRANIPALPPHTWTYHIEPSNFEPAIAYAVFDGHTTGDHQTYAYRTADFGKSWQRLAVDGVEGFARNIQEDYQNPDLLFLGTEFGLYISLDRGESWKKFTNNMPATAVHAIELHPRTHDLILGTHGRGIIIIDDISPLRELNAEVLSSELHFFKPKAGIMKEESSFGGGSGETEFVGSNPSSDARIAYYLKKRHTFGKMVLEIQNEAGETLLELPAGKSKGINVVEWNYTIKQPKMAVGASVAYGGFTPPRVAAGQYKVVLTKGKERYESSLQVMNDPNSLITEAERDAQYRTTRQLYDMTQELAYLVYEIDEYLQLCSKLEKEDPSSAKLMSNTRQSLQNFKEKLVITEGDNYVGRGENKLREDLADLYSKIAGSFEAPTPAELENLKLMEAQMAEARTTMERLRAKELQKLEQYLHKKGLAKPALPSFKEFLAKA